jgi:hypothetical protein
MVGVKKDLRNLSGDNWKMMAKNGMFLDIFRAGQDPKRAVVPILLIIIIIMIKTFITVHSTSRPIILVFTTSLSYFSLLFEFCARLRSLARDRLSWSLSFFLSPIQFRDSTSN